VSDDEPRTTKVHKVILLIVDHDDVGSVIKHLVDVIEDVRYPNRCIHPRVMQVETREVEWTDEHPLNDHAEKYRAFAELFGSEGS
jgi:hypothetical protein